MPNRVIRESILDSERYWNVTIEARQLFIHLMLLADDLGVVSLAPVMLRRRCFDAPPQDKKLESLLLQLVDNDLIRRFEVNDIPYALIPRFRQRLQITKPKFELPPDDLIFDDEWLKNKVNEFKAKRSNPTVAQHPVQHPVQRPESKRNIETNRNEGNPFEVMLKKAKPDQTTDHATIDKNRRIAALLAEGKVEEATKLRNA